MLMLAKVLIGLVAVLHLYFLTLEMFLWRTRAVKIFRMTQEYANTTAQLAGNQGLYNGFLSAGLVWALLSAPDQLQPRAAFFLICVIVAGAYGAYSVNKRIFFIQALPALLALGALFLG